MSRFLLALTTFLLLGATSAHALVQRAYVSALTGNDANTATDCQATAPCRWFGGAISVVSPGGEIVAIDSGAYGSVTITRSISIVAAPGVYAGITVFAGDGITIATAGVDVVLRGLSINGLGGANGIKMTAGNSLVVQNCLIANFISGSGVWVTGTTKVRVLDSLLKANYLGAAFLQGVSVLVSNSRLVDSTYDALYALAIGGGLVTKVEVSRSDASGNGTAGFSAYASSSGRVELNVNDSMASRNGYGVYVNSSGGTALASVSSSLLSGHTGYGLAAIGSGAQLVASGNTVTQNTVGLWADGSGAKLVASGNTVTHNDYGLYQANSAVLESAGDNLVRDNSIPTSGTITTISKM